MLAFWRKCSAIFGENRSAFLEIWRTLFGEIVVGDLEKSFVDFGENCSAILEIWRTLFSEIVVGDLEKSFGDFVLKLVMEYRNARRPYVEVG